MTTYYADRWVAAGFAARWTRPKETLLAHDLSAPVLLSADQELSVAAQAEGLMAEDPNLY